MFAGRYKVVGELELPKLRQLGIVVKDIPRAARHYQSMFGIGPWFSARSMADSVVRRSGRAIDGGFDAAVAYSAGIQIELIQPTGSAETLYTEHLRDCGEGLHHLGFCVSDLDRRVTKARAAGIEVLQSGEVSSGGLAVTRYAYLDTAAIGGIIVELIETKLLGIPVGMSEAMVRLGRLTGDVMRLRL